MSLSIVKSSFEMKEIDLVIVIVHWDDRQSEDTMAIAVLSAKEMNRLDFISKSHERS